MAESEYRATDVALRRRFEAIWTDFVGRGDAASVWARLDAGYGDPSRAYHNWSHIAAMLAGLDLARSLRDFAAVDFAVVELAIWFHDAVYDAKAKDNEEQSAALFLASVGDGADLDPDACDRIAAMIRATATHGPSSDASTRLLLDLDLRILAAPPADYDRYAAAVRTEYAFVPEALWRPGRATVLRTFLDRSAIFQTRHFHVACETPARQNVAREIAELVTSR